MSTAGYRKKVYISTDESTWKELPADTPSLSINSAIQENTDLSNTAGFKGRIYGLRDWSLGLEGNFVPYTTYHFTIKKSGSATTMTGEAMGSVSGNTYKISDASKEIFDRKTVPSFKVGGVAIPGSDVQSINYLDGSVTFKTAKTGAVTVSGKFIPVTAALCVNTAALDLSIEVEEDTNVKSSTNGFKTRATKLKDVSMSISSFNDLNKVIANHLKADETILVEIKLGSSNVQTIRGWFVAESDNASGGTGDLEKEEISLQLAGGLVSSIHWGYPSSGYSEALKILTDYYFTPGNLFVKYLPENTVSKGYQGKVVMESFGLSLDINGKATFSASLQGNGELKDAT